MKVLFGWNSTIYRIISNHACVQKLFIFINLTGKFFINIYYFNKTIHLINYKFSIQKKKSINKFLCRSIYYNSIINYNLLFIKFKSKI